MFENVAAFKYFVIILSQFFKLVVKDRMQCVNTFCLMGLKELNYVVELELTTSVITSQLLLPVT